MNKSDIIKYYKQWTNGIINNQMAIDFTDMLMRKTYFAKINNKKIMAYGKMRTGSELEKIYCIAEDIFCDYPELRGY